MADTPLIVTSTLVSFSPRPALAAGWVGAPPTPRGSPRVRLRAPLSYAHGRRHDKGQTLDLGLGGMAVETAAALPAVGAEVIVVIRLFPHQPLAFNGIVQWRGDQIFGMQYGPMGRLHTRILVDLLARGALAR